MPIDRRSSSSKADTALGRVTLTDVAKDAGVSRATASLVLRGSNLVSDKTRRRVLASMERLGYVYNRAAASLRAQRSHTVGLAVTDITNPFFAELAVAVERYLEEAQYTLLLTNSAERLGKQNALLQMMQGYQVDGLLLCPARGTKAPTLGILQSWSLPVVLIARDVPDSGLDYVGADNIRGAELAVQHLIKKGHERIAFLGGPEDSTARLDRLEGYHRALKQCGITSDNNLSIPGPVTRKGGHDVVQVALQIDNPPTAALCYNDVVAFGTLIGLEAMGRIPGADFAVVGFDNIADSALWHPALTTVSITADQIAEAASSRLLDRIAAPGSPPKKTVIAPELIVRDSS